MQPDFLVAIYVQFPMEDIQTDVWKVTEVLSMIEKMVNGV